MRIGQISKKSGLSRDTIRLYESMGLLMDVTRPNEYNNYKEYPEENLVRLEMIKSMKKFGFTLREIREAMTALERGEGSSDSFRIQFLGKKIESLDNKIKELVKLRDEISTFFIQGCSEDSDFHQIHSSKGAST